MEELNLYKCMDVPVDHGGHHGGHGGPGVQHGDRRQCMVRGTVLCTVLYCTVLYCAGAGGRRDLPHQEREGDGGEPALPPHPTQGQTMGPQFLH